MRQLKLTFLLTVLMSMVGVKSYAWIVVENNDGVKIYYEFINSNKELSVSSPGGTFRYSGNVVIPESVTYEGKTYSVTGIGYEAFYACYNLESVTIPNSVTSIGSVAFYRCI